MSAPARTAARRPASSDRNAEARTPDELGPAGVLDRRCDGGGVLERSLEAGGVLERVGGIGWIGVIERDGAPSEMRSCGRMLRTSIGGMEGPSGPGRHRRALHVDHRDARDAPESIPAWSAAPIATAPSGSRLRDVMGPRARSMTARTACTLESPPVA